MKMPETDKEWTDAFQGFETQKRLNIAKEIYAVVREINMSKLCDEEKGYLEAMLLLVSAMIGGECHEEVKRRIREDESRS